MAIKALTFAKATVLKAAIDNLTGDSCNLQQRETSIKINLTEKQKAWFQNFLDTQLDMKTKPDIEIDALGIVLPVLFKRAWPLMAVGGGALAALFIGKNRK